MSKVTPIIKQFFSCPNCKDHDFEVSHLDKNNIWTRSFTCVSCNAKVDFTYDGTEVDIKDVELPPEGKSHILVLLKPVFQPEGSDKPVYLVVHKPNYIFETDLNQLQRTEEFYYNSHTCPSNYLGGTVVLEGGDDDPHGIFQFQEAVFCDATFDTTEFHNGGGDYSTIFNTLKTV